MTTGPGLGKPICEILGTPLGGVRAGRNAAADLRPGLSGEARRPALRRGLTGLHLMIRQAILSISFDNYYHCEKSEGFPEEQVLTWERNFYSLRLCKSKV